MRVFVTGATGWVGSAVIEELKSGGHSVLGLARSDEGVAKLEAAGVPVHRGSIEDLESLRTGAAAADAVVHTAFNHDFSKFAENGANERLAIEALGDALAGTGKPLIVTSGIGFIQPGRVATEDDNRAADSQIPRDPESVARAVAANGVPVSVIRLAPSVHGKGDHGFVPAIIGMAREKGESAYPNEGANRWPGVHRRDAARLYVLALERAADFAVYHATDEEGVAFREIAAVIGKRLNLPVVSKTGDGIAEHFGWFAYFSQMSAPASSAKTRATLGWKPVEPGLLADLDSDAYFA